MLSWKKAVLEEACLLGHVRVEGEKRDSRYHVFEEFAKRIEKKWNGAKAGDRMSMRRIKKNFFK